MSDSGFPFADLRAFMAHLEGRGELVRVSQEVDPRLEITEIASRLIGKGGPAVLFSRVRGSRVPVLANLFGTQERVAMAVGRTVAQLEELGELLARLKQPKPPSGMGDALSFAGDLARARHMPVRSVARPCCRQVVMQGEAVDLSRFPIQTCWPGDVGPLVTWPVVITQGYRGGPVNLGIYRMQVIGKNRLIMRWLKHRGGALQAGEYPSGRLPVAVAIGCDPATIVAAVTPLPETLSEYAFAGLLRGARVETAMGLTVPLPVPATAEIILEGEVNLHELADEGPFGDHTGYYNEVERFPVFTVKAITTRRDPIYLTTHTGRPPDEPAILALALNRVFVPLLRQQFPEIADFHLPMEACSYRVAVVSIHKHYPGHAFRIMAGIWSFLRQFLYTKFIIVVDVGVPVTDWDAVWRAVCHNALVGEDLHLIGRTPIDYLDFASPVSGLGSKMGVDATVKVGPERRGRAALPAAGEGLPAADFLDVTYLAGGGLAVLRLRKVQAGQVAAALARLWAGWPEAAGPSWLWVVDEAVDPCSWDDLWWALSTRVDPLRDLHYSPDRTRVAVDATHKMAGETSRHWGRVLSMDEGVQRRMDSVWDDWGLGAWR